MILDLTKEGPQNLAQYLLLILLPILCGTDIDKLNNNNNSASEISERLSVMLMVAVGKYELSKFKSILNKLKSSSHPMIAKLFSNPVEVN